MEAVLWQYALDFSADGAWAELVLDLLGLVEVEQGSVLWYAGLSVTTDAAGRVEQDKSGTHHRRLDNLMTAAARAGIALETVPIDLDDLHVHLNPGTSTEQAWRMPEIDIIERTLIAVLGVFSLNRSDGGHRIRVVHLPLERGLLVDARLDPAALHYTTPPDADADSRVDAISRSFRDELAYFVRVEAKGVLDAARFPAAFDNIVTDATSAFMVDSLGCRQLTLSRQVTLSDLHERSTFSGPAAGAGPALRAEMERCLAGDGSDDSFSLVQHRAHRDIFALHYDHERVGESLFFTARILSLADPLFIVTRNAIPHFFLVGGFFDEIGRVSGYSSFCHDGIATSPDKIARMTRDAGLTRLEEPYKPDSIGGVGDCVIARVPTPGAFVLVVQTLDEGIVRYDPEVQDLLLGIGAASLAVARIAESELAQAVAYAAVTGALDLDNPVARSEILHRARDATLRVSNSSGFSSRLSRLKADLFERQAWLWSRRLREPRIEPSDDGEEEPSSPASRVVSFPWSRRTAQGRPLSAYEWRTFEHALVLTEGPGQLASINSALVPSIVAQLPRFGQIELFLERVKDSIRHGVLPPIPIGTSGWQLGSAESLRWLARLAEGVALVRSVALAGRAVPFATYEGLSPAEVAAKRLRLSEQAFRREQRKREFGRPNTLVSRAMTASDFQQRLLVAPPQRAKELVVSTCADCGERFRIWHGEAPLADHPCWIEGYMHKYIEYRPLHASSACLITDGEAPPTDWTVQPLSARLPEPIAERLALIGVDVAKGVALPATGQTLPIAIAALDAAILYHFGIVDGAGEGSALLTARQSEPAPVTSLLS